MGVVPIFCAGSDPLVDLRADVESVHHNVVTTRVLDRQCVRTVGEAIGAKRLPLICLDRKGFEEHDLPLENAVEVYVRGAEAALRGADPADRGPGKAEDGTPARVVGRRGAFAPDSVYVAARSRTGRHGRAIRTS